MKINPQNWLSPLNSVLVLSLFRTFCLFLGILCFKSSSESVYNCLQIQIFLVSLCLQNPEHFIKSNPSPRWTVTCKNIIISHYIQKFHCTYVTYMECECFQIFKDFCWGWGLCFRGFRGFAFYCLRNSLFINCVTVNTLVPLHWRSNSLPLRPTVPCTILK